MKNKFQKIIFALLFFSTNIALSQGPDPDNLPGDLNPTDAPVNQYLILVTMASIVFVYCILSKKSRTIKH
jgi:hypothetical protein